MLRDATAASLLEVLDRNKIPHDVNRAENFVVIRDTKSKILFRAVEEFERLRGSNLAWFGVDELTYTRSKPGCGWKAGCGTPRRPGLGGFAVWTPRGYDWVYERFVARKIAGYETVIGGAFRKPAICWSAFRIITSGCEAATTSDSFNRKCWAGT